MPLYIFFPILIVALAIVSIVLIIKSLKIYYGRKKKRSPFTDKFLRSPGQSLLQKIEDINIDLSAYIVFLICLPFMLYGGYMSDIYFREQPLLSSSAMIYFIMFICFWGYFVFKIVRLINSRRNMRLGYDGEVATGQELNRMMFHGYHVFHDFVADKFNIDHVVVGTAGVFAVETKGRAKLVSGNGAADAKVIYDGKRLKFPKSIETKPIEQAQRQAQWLSCWLSSATGEKIAVRPVLALPGWFVERISADGIPVINPKQFKSIAKPINGKVLDERRIKSIVHQIDQRCRNIESKAVEGLGGSMSEGAGGGQS